MLFAGLASVDEKMDSRLLRGCGNSKWKNAAMFGFLNVTLSSDEIEALEGEIIQAAQVGEEDAAWQKVERLRKAQHHQVEAVVSLLRIVSDHCLQTDNAADVLSE
ncbi:MAG: hypothetical protein HKN05_14535, partial [Rhizobiales bacterium]|nr:hypothetical protein [Hyphomicrobiales bacterium]